MFSIHTQLISELLTTRFVNDSKFILLCPPKATEKRHFHLFCYIEVRYARTQLIFFAALHLYSICITFKDLLIDVSSDSSDVAITDYSTLSHESQEAKFVEMNWRQFRIPHFSFAERISFLYLKCFCGVKVPT
jgi:hypothetical protein